MGITSESDLVTVIMAGFYILIGATAIPLNIVCLMAMHKAKAYRKSEAYILFALLCVADVQFSLAMIMSGTFRYFMIFANVPFIELVCHLLLAIPSMGAILSNLTTLAIACERLLVVTATALHRKHGASLVKTAVCIILAITLASFIDGLTDRSPTKIIPACFAATWVSKAWQDKVAIYGTFVPSGICCVIYAWLVYAFRKHNRNVVGQMALADEQQRRREKNEYNLTVTSVLICTVYVCFTAGGLLLVWFVGPAVLQQAVIPGTIVLHLGGMLTGLKPVANAVILIWRNGEVRKQAIRDWNGCVRCCLIHTTPHVSSVNNSTASSGTSPT